MITGLAVALALAALVLLAWLHLRFWTPRLEPRRRYALVERIATEDGSAIELRRLGLAEVADVDRQGVDHDEAHLSAGREPLPPILVVHGIGIDHRNNDMFDGRSLVRALAARGRDVWLVTLRSGRMGLPFGERALVTFERMARHDVPLAAREVLRRTGQGRLDYVGFSMGGMLLYAGLALRTLDVGALRRVAIIGSPGQVAAPFPFLERVARVWPLALVPPIWLGIPSRLVAFVAGHLRTPIHRLIIEPDELSPTDVGAALVTVRDIPRRLFQDFARFVRLGRVEVDGVAVLPALAHVRVPALFVAGAGDRVAPPDMVRAGHDAWGAAVPDLDKRWHLASRAGGAAADYGHGDLAFGIHAPRDVFPPVLEHLAER